jgi:aspartate/methionine/tyrosine aminotransferase
MSIASDLTIATRVATIAASATSEMADQIKRAQASGRQILPLAVGDPNLPTHPLVAEAACRSIRDGETLYDAAQGRLTLRTAVAQHISNQSGVAYEPDEIVITQGAIYGLLACLLSVVEPGQEVIVLDPSWVSFVPAVRLCGGVPVEAPCLNEIDVEAIAAAVTPRTRMIMVNSPVNPTGRVLSATELRGLVAVAERYGLWLLFDQVYATMVFDGPFPFLQAREGARERTFVVDSLSKGYGMTGWRVGYVAVPQPMTESILKVVQHGVYCVPPFVQAAAEAALALPDSVIAGYRAEFRAKRDIAVERLSRIPGIVCPPPAATFYLFPKIEGDDRAIAQAWLDQLSIAVMPGSAFGQAGRGHLRLSLACQRPVLIEALDRIERYYSLVAANPAGRAH